MPTAKGVGKVWLVHGTCRGYCGVGGCGRPNMWLINGEPECRECEQERLAIYHEGQHWATGYGPHEAFY